MRENSGQGDAENNLRDPTLKEHEAEGRYRAPRPASGDEAVIGGNARERGEKPSPSDRERGERSSADRTPPIDAGGE
jgi:hypothetical protein